MQVQTRKIVQHVRIIVYNVQKCDRMIKSFGLTIYNQDRTSKYLWSMVCVKGACVRWGSIYLWMHFMSSRMIKSFGLTMYNRDRASKYLWSMVFVKSACVR